MKVTGCRNVTPKIGWLATELTSISLACYLSLIICTARHQLTTCYLAGSYRQQRSYREQMLIYSLRCPSFGTDSSVIMLLKRHQLRPSVNVRIVPTAVL